MVVSNAQSTISSPSAKCRVMIVDDSLVIRGILRKILMSDSEIEVVASVGNGKLAIEALDKYDVDAAILDIEMPIMDGLTALPLMLKKQSDLVVLVASTLSLKNADISMKCLELGAKDYIPKPSTQAFTATESDFKRDIITKLKNITQAIRNKKIGSTKVLSSANKSLKSSGQAGFSLRDLPSKKPDAIMFGSSTGGPQALCEVLKNTSGKFSQPIFITQHMPPLFTKSLATHLERTSGIPAKEGEDGEIVKGGQIYIAPGNFHMEVVSRGANKVIKLSQTPLENFCRPSVNPLFRSVAKSYAGNALCVMLTGLGADGSQGAKDFVSSGGTIIAQDEATSVVWGMPGAVAKEGLCAAILPVKKIGSVIDQIANALNPRAGVEL